MELRNFIYLTNDNLIIEERIGSRLVSSTTIRFTENSIILIGGGLNPYIFLHNYKRNELIVITLNSEGYHITKSLSFELLGLSSAEIFTVTYSEFEPKHLYILTLNRLIKVDVSLDHLNKINQFNFETSPSHRYIGAISSDGFIYMFEDDGDFIIDNKFQRSIALHLKLDSSLSFVFNRHIVMGRYYDYGQQNHPLIFFDINNNRFLPISDELISKTMITNYQWKRLRQDILFNSYNVVNDLVYILTRYELQKQTVDVLSFDGNSIKITSVDPNIRIDNPRYVSDNLGNYVNSVSPLKDALVNFPRIHMIYEKTNNFDIAYNLAKNLLVMWKDRQVYNYMNLMRDISDYRKYLKDSSGKLLIPILKSIYYQ